jgi:hypothetical protein
VYRTTVISWSAAKALLDQLRRLFPDWCISFDLEDCDKVLRVESPDDSIPTDFIASLLQRSGYECQPLPD